MEGQHEHRGKGRGRNRSRQRTAVEPGVPSRRPLMVIMVLLLLLLTALVATVYPYIQGGQAATKSGGLVYEVNIVEGGILGKSMEEMRRELDSIVEKGMPVMSINAIPFKRTSGTDRNTNWVIEDPSNQGKLIRAKIWRDDTGEKVYETGAIPPENYVKSAPLKVFLPLGEYRCTTRLYTYREEDEAYIDQVDAQIKLTLQE